VQDEFPRDGSFGVSRFTDVEVLFSESVRGVDEDTFRLFNARTGRSVFAHVFRDGTSRRWLLDPRGALSRSTRYVAVLRGGSFGIRDLSGNRLSSTDWSFRTSGFRHR
jgi:hypothetical protein